MEYILYYVVLCVLCLVRLHTYFSGSLSRIDRHACITHKDSVIWKADPPVSISRTLATACWGPWVNVFLSRVAQSDSIPTDIYISWHHLRLA